MSYVQKNKIIMKEEVSILTVIKKYSVIYKEILNEFGVL